MSGFTVKRHENSILDNYSVLAHQLGAKPLVVLEGHTSIHKPEMGAIAIQLHETDILTFYRDGRVKFDTGGWATMFTDQRMNKYCPDGLSVYSARGKWMLSVHPDADPSTNNLYRPDGATSYRFYNGITVDLNTMQVVSEDPGTAAWDAYNRDIDKKIKEYWKGFTNDLIIVDKCSIHDEREHVLYHLEHEDHMYWIFLQAITDAGATNPSSALDYYVQTGSEHYLKKFVNRFFKRTLYKGVTAVR